MIHTATITHQLPKADYERLKQRYDFTWNADEQRYFYHDEQYNRVLKTNGVNGITLYTCRDSSYTRYTISMTINFKKLVSQTKTIELYNIAMFGKIQKKFDVFMYFLGLNDKDLDYSLTTWTISRIDFCQNVKTEYVTEYLKLLKKGNTYTYHDLKKYVGSCYVVGQSTNINIYDKEQESEYKFADISKNEVQNTLRVEVQCKSPKMYYDRYTYGDTWYYFMSDNKSRTILTQALTELRATKKYVTLKQGIRTIQDSTYRQTTKDKLIEFYKSVNKQHSNINKAKEKYLSEGYTKEQVNRMIRQIEQLDICVVSIPRDWHIQTLPALTELVQKSYIA